MTHDMFPFLETSLSSPKPNDDSTALDRLDNVHCTGTEWNLADCAFDIVNLRFYTSAEMACGYSKRSYIEVLINPSTYNLHIYNTIEHICVFKTTLSQQNAWLQPWYRAAFSYQC